jgi:hypothetical protein
MLAGTLPTRYELQCTRQEMRYSRKEIYKFQRPLKLSLRFFYFLASTIFDFWPFEIENGALAGPINLSLVLYCV